MVRRRPIATSTDTLFPSPTHFRSVRIRGAGFCHTDLLPRSPLVPTPVVTGHEGAGVVEAVGAGVDLAVGDRSEEHSSELQSLLRTAYAVFCLKKNTDTRPSIREKQH